MKRFILIIFFQLTVLFINGQTGEKTIFFGKIVSDSFTLEGSYYDWNVLPSILKSNYEIEIRYINYSSNFTNYTILTYDKKWSAKYFNLAPDKNSLISKDIISETTIDTIFSRLVLNNIFSLPGESSESLVFNPETGIGMCDGPCYSIEFKVSDNFRKYSYYDPECKATFITNDYQYRSFANIVEIFSEWLKE